MFAKRSLEPIDTVNYQPLLDSPYVQRLYLDELEAGDGTLGVEMVKMVVEPEEDTKQNIRQVVAQAQQIPDATLRREIVELIEVILLYKFPRLSREEIEAMLGVSDIKQTKVYQEALEEGRLERSIEVATEMLTHGMSVELVQQMTKLSRKAVLELQESIAGR